MSKRYNRRNIGEGHKRMSFKNLAVIIFCAVLAASALLASVAFLSKGFTNTDVTSWFERELNPDNLIKEENYVDNLEDELENGLKINYKDSGEIVLYGKVDDDSITGDQTPDPITFVSVTVDPGKVYTLSSGNKNASEKTFGLQCEWVDANGEKVSAKAADDALKIDLTKHTEAVTLTISFYYENDVTYFGINSYLRPTLVVGESAGDFYK
jgi:hypothetical protein